MYHPTERTAHTTAFVTPVVEHWLEREIAQWVHNEGSHTDLVIISCWKKGNVLFNDTLNTFTYDYIVMDIW